MPGSKSGSPRRSPDREEVKNDNGGRRYGSSRSSSRGRGGQKRSATPQNDNTGNVLYVGNLGKDVDEKELQDYFEKIGRVTQINMVRDPFTKECRGFGFITLQNVEDATEAVRELDQKEYHGRKLKIEKSKRGHGHAKTPGEYLGHYKSNNRGHRRSQSPYRRGGRRYRSRSRTRRSNDRHSRERRTSRDRYSRERRSSRDRYHRSHSRDRSRSRDRYRGRDYRSRSRDRRSNSRNRRK